MNERGGRPLFSRGWGITGRAAPFLFLPSRSSQLKCKFLAFARTRVLCPPRTKQRVSSTAGVESGANIRSPPPAKGYVAVGGIIICIIHQRYSNYIWGVTLVWGGDGIWRLLYFFRFFFLSRRKKLILILSGGNEGRRVCRWGGRKKKNVLTISRLIYRRALVSFPLEERERRVVFWTFLSFSLRSDRAFVYTREYLYNEICDWFIAALAILLGRKTKRDFAFTFAPSQEKYYAHWLIIANSFFCSI